MFAVIITEKGGTERREVFDKTEINVGRVQGNELMLPKGNVSKHHARLLYRDGRFIVTDLKSTNGTYVNGRKITQATIVREGDKIYIGDFIIRLETPQQEAAIAEAPAAAAAPAPPARSSPGINRESQARAEGSAVSHYPLENDPDDASWAGESVPGVRVPAPPRLPSAQRRGTAPRSPAGAGTVASAQIENSAVSSMPKPMPSRPAMPPREPSTGPNAIIEPARVTPQRQAAAALIRHIEDTFDLSALDQGSVPDKALGDRLERALREEAPNLQSRGTLPAQVDLEAVIRDARDELLGLGPLDALLRDDDISELHIHRATQVVSIHPSGTVRNEVPFASDASLLRILRRLCTTSGGPLRDDETTIDRVVQPGSAHLVAALPPMAQPGPVASFRKSTAISQSFEDLVRGGVMSRAMASLLGQAIAGHLNILVSAAPGCDPRSLVSAMLGSTRAPDHVIVVQDPSSTLTAPAHATSLMASRGENSGNAVHAAAQLRPDAIFVMSFDPHMTAEVLDAVGAGVEGVVTTVRAASLRHALARLAPEVAACRSGVPLEALRESISASFDLMVEFTRLRDGRTRVLRISEPAGVDGKVIAVRDIFTFNVERTAAGGVIEGSFQSSGVVPRAAQDLTARGLSVDSALFHR